MLKNKTSNLEDIFTSVQIKDNIATMYIYGDIVSTEYDSWNEEDIYPGFVSQFLESSKGKELHIHINSNGGSVFAGVTIYNLLKSRQGKTITYIDALAASSASLIALAGDEIVMPTGSMLMIHKPWIHIAGNSNELREQANKLDDIEKNFIEIYKENLNNQEDFYKVKEMVDKETWLNSWQCKTLFKNITVNSSIQACACIKSESLKYYNIPKSLKIDEGIEKDSNDGDKYQKEALNKELEIEGMLLKHNFKM